MKNLILNICAFIWLFGIPSLCAWFGLRQRAPAPIHDTIYCDSILILTTKNDSSCFKQSCVSSPFLPLQPALGFSRTKTSNLMTGGVVLLTVSCPSTCSPFLSSHCYINTCYNSRIDKFDYG